MTLLELIITSALVLLLGTLFAWFLVTTSQITSQGSARVDIQQRAVLVTRRICQDLEKSDRKSIALHSQAEAAGSERIVVAAIPLQDVDPEGGRLWKDEVVGYFWDREEKELSYRGWPPKTSPTAFSVDPLPRNYAYRLTDDELLQFADGNGVRLARKVVDFDVFWVGNAINIKIAIEQDVAGKQAPLRFDYEKVVAIRN